MVTENNEQFLDEKNFNLEMWFDYNCYKMVKWINHLKGLVW